ncbi:MAG: S41 family peptidase [Bacteroidales bacterium]|jgi:carboxyl-terminal processing protease|nr:S41 family peptidase [Bacteroidales bacterium]
MNKLKKSILQKRSLILFAGMMWFTIHTTYSQRTPDAVYNMQVQKMNRLLQLIRYFYVDSVNLNKIMEKGTVEMLKELDPHSTYIPQKDVTRTNEPLQGNFEGIGVSFQIIKDTIVVVQPVKGGPSEQVGIIAGDKIIQIDDSIAVGKICTNAWVFSKLRGKKGTKVVVKIRRGKNPDPLTFTIIRDKIPINSIEAYFMINKEDGYLKLERFSQTTMDEFKKAVRELQAQGMKNLVFDLRGNTGGYLNTAVELADEFLTKDKLVVYTQNTNKNFHNNIRQTYNTTNSNGLLEKGKLIVLIDEASASASEIVSGAIQDWDRGIIVGRRSFGKGLVQMPTMLPDSSIIRLTTSRYYIPSGRYIQKPYEGVEDYSRDAIKRYNAGELTNADSIHFPDSLKYFTQGKRVVYGGGGIMPDVFVPMDTTRVSDYYWRLFRNNIFNQFAMSYLEREKDNLLKRYPTFDDFNSHFHMTPELLQEFSEYAAKENVKDSAEFNFKAYLEGFIAQNKDTLNKVFGSFEQVKNHDDFKKMLSVYIEKEIDKKKKENERFDTRTYIERQLKTLMARNLYDANKATKIWLEMDETYLKALEIISDTGMFKKLKITY